MINVNTFIKYKDMFFDIYQYAGPRVNENNLEGGIILTINNTTLIDLEMWDYIIELWSYILEGLEYISRETPFECNFPDQPILLKMTPIKSNVLLEITIEHTKKVFIDKNILMKKLCQHIIKFFSKIVEIPGISHSYSLEIKRAKHLIENSQN